MTDERHEQMETEGGLQTVRIREEREYLSLSSWMREEGVKLKREGGEGGERCQRSMGQVEEVGSCRLRYKMTLRSVVPLIQWRPVQEEDACFHYSQKLYQSNLKNRCFNLIS